MPGNEVFSATRNDTVPFARRSPSVGTILNAVYQKVELYHQGIYII